jgi:hypothetical protein
VNFNLEGACTKQTTHKLLDTLLNFVHNSLHRNKQTKGSSMTTITLWLLIAAGNGLATPANIAQFATEKDCLSAAATMQRLTREKSFMTPMYGVCVEAKVVK